MLVLTLNKHEGIRIGDDVTIYLGHNPRHPVSQVPIAFDISDPAIQIERFKLEDESSRNKHSP